MTLLLMLWGTLKFLLIPTIVLFTLMQVMTPSLRYSAKSSADTYTDDMPNEWGQVVSSTGQSWSALRTAVLTKDYRHLKIDYLAPPNSLQGGNIPITIIVAGFMPPEWLIDRVRPRGQNAVVVYRSPRLARMTGPSWPTLTMFRDARKFSDFWNLVATNPINRLYSIHAGLHEAPADVVDIVTWARKNISADVNRINLIGLGSGSLIVAAAAHKLQAIGSPARTLTLIYPPALKDSAIQDNLIETPRWLRPFNAALLDKLYFRLNLQRHLPKVGDSTAKLVFIPRNSFDLATYAAEPTLQLTGANTTSEFLDVNFTGFYDLTNADKIRDAVYGWLSAQGGIN
jgi:hypothetical protein